MKRGFDISNDPLISRDIIALKISLPDSNASNAIYFQGGQHAREWIGPATVLYLTDYILNNINSDTELNSVLKKADFYIVPGNNIPHIYLILQVVNPDGYEYTRQSSSTRLWRKSRRNNGNNVYGVDLNRFYSSYT